MALPAGLMPLAEPRLPPHVADHELLRRIGGGSYGEVWLARNLIGTYRAVKVVYRNGFEADRPFEREFAGIKRFEPISRLHESQVDILHVGRADDCFYYVMELADDAGEAPGAVDAAKKTTENHSAVAVMEPERYVPKTLRTELKRRGKLPFEECVELGLTLCTALENLHSHKLVHRDIKPSNIIFINGTPKLADIGLVTGVDATRSYVGTEGYIPPEGAGTPQADIYSLGKVLYEMGTGMDRQDFPEPPSFWEESARESAWLEFHEVLLRACETQPGRRYQSVAELRGDLELLRAGKSVRRLRTVERRLKRLSRLGLAASLLLVGVAGAYLFSVHETRQAKVEARRADLEAARAQSRLWDSYLAQAQARRSSGRPGRRFESLEALRKAADLRFSIELRNEAVDCLALADLRVQREWDAMIPGINLLVLDTAHERYARADDKGNISFRSMPEDRELFQLPGFGAPAESDMALSPDGKWLAVFYLTNSWEACVWDVEHRTIKFKPVVNGGRCFSFSPDSKLLAVAQHDGPILVFDVGSGGCARSLEQKLLPWDVAFSPDGQKLAVSSDRSRFVEIRDLATGAVLLQPLGHSNVVRGMSWHPSRELLATACADQRIYIWDTRAGVLRSVLTAQQGAITRVCYNHRGDLLVSYGWGGTLCLWDALNGHLLLSDAGRSGGGFSRDDRWLITSRARKFELCEVASGEECLRLYIDSARGGETTSCDFSPDGRHLVSAHSDGVSVWDLDAQRQTALLPEGETRCARFQGPQRLVTAGVGGLKRRDIAREESTGQWRFGTPTLFPGEPAMLEWFSMCADGGTVVFNTPGGGDLFILDGTGWRPQAQLSGGPGTRFFGSAISPDGRWIAAADTRHTSFRVWDMGANNRARDFPCSGINSLGFSRDSQWLVTGSSEYKCWDTHSWQCAYRVPRREGSLAGRIAFSPDNHTVAVTDTAQSVRLMELKTGREYTTFEMPEPQVIIALAFSPDGARLAVAGQTQVIHVWNLRRIRQELAELKLDW